MLRFGSNCSLKNVLFGSGHGREICETDHESFTLPSYFASTAVNQDFNIVLGMTLNCIRSLRRSLALLRYW